ncbi:MAG: hypothetical protein JNK27_07235 [Chitinophagaceae bacterium]|nr:hypothetical protein [Chitinophagaceae bacterium]
MEVHAHTHTARKKWTHYFWEFLMLFLAVFCGFLAEYQLEHKIEHDREKQYMKTLVEDLKADTTNYNTTLRFWKQTDSAIAVNRPLIKPPIAKENISKAYRLAAALMNSDEFVYNDRTIEQLRGSGSFRLIRNDSISGSLIRYDSYIRNSLRSQEKFSQNILQNLLHIQNEIFDSELLESYFINNSAGNYEHLLKEINPSKNDLLFKYYNEIFLYKSIIYYIIISETRLKQKAIALIELIKRSYHLK